MSHIHCERVPWVHNSILHKTRSAIIYFEYFDWIENRESIHTQIDTQLKVYFFETWFRFSFIPFYYCTVSTFPDCILNLCRKSYLTVHLYMLTVTEYIEQHKSVMYYVFLFLRSKHFTWSRDQSGTVFFLSISYFPFSCNAKVHYLLPDFNSRYVFR